MKRIALAFVFCLSVGLGSVWADIVDWSQFGPPFTVLSSPQVWTSLLGQTGVVGVVGGGTFERLDQGNGWNGNFLPGSPLIWNQGNGDFIFAFDTAVAGVGMAVQADLFGPFTATLTVYDSGGNPFGTTVMNGVSNANADGSAIFISFNSNVSDIFYAQVGVVDWLGGDSMGACAMSLKPNPGAPSQTDPCTTTSPTPEPGSLPLLSTGVFFLVGYTRRLWRMA